MIMATIAGSRFDWKSKSFAFYGDFMGYAFPFGAATYDAQPTNYFFFLKNKNLKCSRKIQKIVHQNATELFDYVGLFVIV